MKVPSLFPRAISVLSALFIFLALAAPHAHAQNSFSYPPFPVGSAAGLQVNGSASIAANGATNYLQLTSASNNNVGSAWYTNPSGQSEGVPATLALSGGFNTTFVLQFTGQGGINNGGRVGADGIAFIVQNGSFAANGSSGAGAVGPSDGLGGEIGFNGLTKSVAVQFDTWCNGEYGDTCAAPASPTSADQVTIESCGIGANTVTHGTTCEFGTIDLSTLESPIYLGDTNTHTVQIKYVPPAGTENCPSGSMLGTSGCGTLTIVIDKQTVLNKAFSLGIINGYSDSTDSAFVGFTGATGGSFELQAVNSWNFGVTVAQTFNTTTPTTANFSNGGNENQLTLDLSTANGNLSCNGQTGNTCPQITLLTTNNTVSASSTWPQYVNGTPWATSVCAARPGNGGTGNLCSLFVNACYGGNISQSQASDYYCPSVKTDTNGTITLSDTWDPLSPKPAIAPGTTVSLLDFVPTTPMETWTASGPGQNPNPVCTNVSFAAFNCAISDTLEFVYGDQTTTRGSRPKKGWIVTVFNVPMLSTQWSVLTSGANSTCPTPTTQLNNNPGSSTAWFNGSCQLQYAVSQATAPPQPNNGYAAAPPSSITYGLGPAIEPGASDASQTNTSMQSPTWTVVPGTISNVLKSLGGSGLDGSYTLHWSAVDNVGISEKNIQLDAKSGDMCANPVDSTSPIKAPCYNTTLFTTQINVDSTLPTIASAGFSPAGSPAGTFYVGETAYPTYTCTDPLSGGVASGILTCAGVSVNSCPATVTVTSTTALSTSSSGTFMTPGGITATDCAGNVSAASTPVNYTVAPNDNLQIKTLPLLTISTGIPGLLPITYGAAITNLSPAAADNVTVTTTFSALPNGVVLGTPTATISTVTCSNTPCTLRGITISTVACSASWPTITCSVPTLGPVSSKTGLWMEIIVPVAKNSKAGGFTSTSTVSSSGIDPVPGNNTTTQTYNVL